MSAKPNIAAVTTIATPFHGTGSEQQPYYHAFNSGVPFRDALEHSACLLDAADHLFDRLAEHDIPPEMYSAQFLMQAARAAIDASLSGIRQREREQQEIAEEAE